MLEISSPTRVPEPKDPVQALSARAREGSRPLSLVGGAQCSCTDICRGRLLCVLGLWLCL